VSWLIPEDSRVGSLVRFGLVDVPELSGACTEVRSLESMHASRLMRLAHVGHFAG